MNFRHLLIVAAAPTISLLTVASPASAHASLQSSNPVAGSVVEEPPERVVLLFTESVDVVPDSIRVVAADGESVEVDETAQELGTESLTVDLPALADGTYVIAWKAVSADSHPINGAFTFSVGTQTETTPGLVEGLVDDQSTRAAPEVWLGLGRWMSFAGMAVVIGGLVALLVCAPDLLQTSRARNMLLIASGVGIAGTAVMIGAQAAVTSTGALSVSAWRNVFDSNAGRWWFARLPVLAGLLCLVGLRRYAARTTWQAAVAVASSSTLAAYAAGGHAVSGRATMAGFYATVGHLAAMSIWFGGLVVMIALIRGERIWAFATRFSPIALGAVAVLAATGVFNGWRQLGTLSGFTESTYGRWLLVKLALVVTVLAVAGTSRWMLRPGDRVSPPIVEAMANQVDRRDPPLKRTVIVEAIGIVLILAATAGLLNATPPLASSTGPASVSVVEGDRIAQLILDPAVTGGTTMHVYISSTGGLLDRPDEITVEADLPAQQVGPLVIPTVTAGPDHVTTNEANLPLAGLWTFTITVRYGDFDQVVFTAELEVR